MDAAPLAPNRRSAILHRRLDRAMPVAAGGEGPYLLDAEGRRWFDGSGGAAVSCLGHSHPAVKAAVKAQIDRLAFAHSGFFTTEPAEALARHLLDRAPAGFGEGGVILLGSGSEAIEAALKLARQHFVERGEPGRGRIIARDMAYHGATLGALAAGGHPARRAPYAPMLIEVGRVPACHAYRGRADGESEADYGRRVADALEAEILRLGPGSVAAFLAETVSGATLGAAPPVPGYFARIREICDRHGVLLIADEVMCGMGRTGALFAMEAEGAAPDIVVVAKGLGAGYQPIAAAIASERVVAPLRAGSGALANGQTYMGHAAACAGALAVLETIEREGLLERVRVLGDRLAAGLEARLGDHPHVGDLRGRGLFRGVEIVRDRAAKRPFPAEARIAERLKAEAFARGLICYPAAGGADGRLGDHVLLAPPFISTEAQIDGLVETLAAAVERVTAEPA